MQFPSSGLQRRHTVGLVMGSAGNEFLVTGTAAGDLCVFSLNAKVFRTAIPVVNNGVSALTIIGGTLYVGGGDGRVRALKGSDVHWDMLAENVIEAPVVGLAASQDGVELICGSRNGKLWRLLTSDLTATLQSTAHLGSVNDVAFAA